MEKIPQCIVKQGTNVISINCIKWLKDFDKIIYLHIHMYTYV